MQWMTAGSGLLHAEMMVASRSHTTDFKGFQIWLNLPARDRMIEPSYEMLWKRDIPVVQLPDVAGQVSVIGGEFNGTASRVRKVSVLLVTLNAGGVFSFAAPAGHSCTVFLFEGAPLSVGERLIEPQHYALMADDGDHIKLANKAAAGGVSSQFLLLSGKSFREPMFHRGPFVGSTREEVRQAFEDLAAGRFGEVAGFREDNHFTD